MEEERNGNGSHMVTDRVPYNYLFYTCNSFNGGERSMRTLFLSIKLKDISFSHKIFKEYETGKGNEV